MMREYFRKVACGSGSEIFSFGLYRSRSAMRHQHVLLVPHLVPQSTTDSIIYWATRETQGKVDRGYTCMDLPRRDTFM